MAKFGIKVDYFHCDDKGEIYTVPCYLFTDRSKHKLLVFDENIDRDDIDLRLFNTREEAEEYFLKHGFDKDLCCCENARIVKIKCEETKGE